MNADGTDYDKCAHRNAMRRQKRQEHQVSATAGSIHSNAVLDNAAERSARNRAHVAQAAADPSSPRHQQATVYLDSHALRERLKRAPMVAAAHAKRQDAKAEQLAARATPRCS